MSNPTPFEIEVLQALRELKSDVSELKSDVSELKSDVSELKSGFSELKSDMRDVKLRLTGLEDTVLNMRDEMRGESSSTRALISQAFEHISDQMVAEGKPQKSSAIFRTRRWKAVIV
jgi:chromosome segregation ATPase